MADPRARCSTCAHYIKEVIEKKDKKGGRAYTKDCWHFELGKPIPGSGCKKWKKRK